MILILAYLSKLDILGCRRTNHTLKGSISIPKQNPVHKNMRAVADENTFSFFIVLLDMQIFALR